MADRVLGVPVRVDPTLPPWTARIVAANGDTADIELSPSPTDLMELVGDIDWPCAWAHLYGNIDGPGTPYRMRECERPAVWRVKWRELCASGSVFPHDSIAGAELTLCHPHFMYLTDYAARRRRGEILHCSACKCEVVDIAHLLDSWHRIK